MGIRIGKGIAGSAAAAMIIIAACSAVHAAPMVADEAFAQEAAKGGAMEVMLGNKAEHSAGNSGVRRFGRQMVDDHSAVNKKLAATAKSLGITLDWEPSAADKAMARKLTHLSGAAFDKAYARDMVEDHKKDVAAFEKEAGYGKTPQLRQFAQQTLPKLKMHLQMAQSLQPKVSGYAHHSMK